MKRIKAMGPVIGIKFPMRKCMPKKVRKDEFAYYTRLPMELQLYICSFMEFPEAVRTLSTSKSLWSKRVEALNFINIGDPYIPESMLEEGGRQLVRPWILLRWSMVEEVVNDITATVSINKLDFSIKRSIKRLLAVLYIKDKDVFKLVREDISKRFKVFYTPVEMFSSICCFYTGDIQVLLYDLMMDKAPPVKRYIRNLIISGNYELFRQVVKDRVSLVQGMGGYSSASLLQAMVDTIRARESSGESRAWIGLHPDRRDDILRLLGVYIWKKSSTLVESVEEFSPKISSRSLCS